MFRDINLETIPERLLPATTLVNNCYEGMFASCGNLTSIPEGLLPATTLAPYCYSHMFDSCRLKNIPRYILPATNLANNCYEYMFANNSYITYTPGLPAENLADDCYKYMFQLCDKLSSVSFGGNTIGLNWTLGWLDRVSKKGTFYYSYKWLKIERGDYAVPLDWDIIAPD